MTFSPSLPPPPPPPPGVAVVFLGLQRGGKSVHADGKWGNGGGLGALPGIVCWWEGRGMNEAM